MKEVYYQDAATGKLYEDTQDVVLVYTGAGAENSYYLSKEEFAKREVIKSSTKDLNTSEVIV